MRFGIGMNSDHTLEEVGQQFSVTRERIRQIEAKALRKLKHPTRARKLKNILRRINELTLLGTGCPKVDHKRFGPSNLITSKKTKVLVDCGSG